MSRALLNRSPDLLKLVADGYEVSFKGGYLLITHVPYVNARKEVAVGTLVSILTLAGEATTRPGDHIAYFIGGHPCNSDGSEIAGIKNQSLRETLAPGLEVDHRFSNKPEAGYQDYHEKVTTYVTIISGPAEALDPTATARTRRVVSAEEAESVFLYQDTASTRAGISAATAKLALARVAIVGLGGTGSYVLDLVAKTPVKEIHLFDGDWFLQHNAFRAPGAASLDQLTTIPLKVDYWSAIYSKMRRGIVPHDRLGPDTLGNLDGMDFAFICMDSGKVKEAVVSKLEAVDVPFIDVGMGLVMTDGLLGGILRVTTSLKGKRAHVRVKNRISFADDAPEDEYDKNIQIADLNSLNATLAVIKWKKHCGFYRDLEKEVFCTYTIDSNMLLSEGE